MAINLELSSMMNLSPYETFDVKPKTLQKSKMYLKGILNTKKDNKKENGK